MTSGPNDIVQLGQLDNVGIVIILVKGLGIESGCENRLQMPFSLFLSSPVSSTGSIDILSGIHIKTHVVLLDDLLEAGIVQLNELC